MRRWPGIPHVAGAQFTPGTAGGRTAPTTTPAPTAGGIKAAAAGLLAR